MKKFLVILMIVIMSLALVACDEPAINNNNTPSGGSSSGGSSSGGSSSGGSSSGGISGGGSALPPDGDFAYKVEISEFYFSTDNGQSYGNRRIEFPVGEHVYMQMQVKIVNSDPNKPNETITGSLVIPNISSLDAYYLKGQKITPNVDEINNVTTYPFRITKNEVWTFFFEFVPTSVSRVNMELNFDDPIPVIYNVSNTIKFVEPKAEGEQNSNGDTTPGETAKIA